MEQNFIYRVFALPAIFVYYILFCTLPTFMYSTTRLIRHRLANISQKTVNGSARRQLAQGTTDDKSANKVLRRRKYMHRKASRKTHSMNGVNIESRVT